MDTETFMFLPRATLLITIVGALFTQAAGYEDTSATLLGVSLVTAGIYLMANLFIHLWKWSQKHGKENQSGEDRIE